MRTQGGGRQAGGVVGVREGAERGTAQRIGRASEQPAGVAAGPGDGAVRPEQRDEVGQMPYEPRKGPPLGGVGRGGIGRGRARRGRVGRDEAALDETASGAVASGAAAGALGGGMGGA